jgi:hypothetical protein
MPNLQLLAFFSHLDLLNFELLTRKVAYANFTIELRAQLQ